jgi:hypothetical protein
LWIRERVKFKVIVRVKFKYQYSVDKPTAVLGVVDDGDG